MFALVVYDSLYGNTDAIAHAIGEGLGGGARVGVMNYRDVSPRDVERADILVVGCPTHAFRPTPEIVAFIDALPPLAGKSVAAFDTRIAAADAPAVLRWIMSFAGYAADVIARKLREKGGAVSGEPDGFIVMGKEGPLKSGEAERAAAWARSIAPAAWVREAVPA